MDKPGGLAEEDRKKLHALLHRLEDTFQELADLANHPLEVSLEFINEGENKEGVVLEKRFEPSVEAL